MRRYVDGRLCFWLYLLVGMLGIQSACWALSSQRKRVMLRAVMLLDARATNAKQTLQEVVSLVITVTRVAVAAFSAQASPQTCPQSNPKVARVP